MNKSIISGNVVREPDVRQGDNLIAKYTVAVSRGKDKEADFINCVAFGKTAELIEKYVSKGSKVLVEGSIKTGSYTNKEGVKVYTTDILTDRIEFLNRKDDEREISGDDVMKFINTPANKDDGFMKIPDNVGDEGLPFN